MSCTVGGRWQWVWGGLSHCNRPRCGRLARAGAALRSSDGRNLCSEGFAREEINKLEVGSLSIDGERVSPYDSIFGGKLRTFSTTLSLLPARERLQRRLVLTTCPLFVATGRPFGQAARRMAPPQRQASARSRLSSSFPSPSGRRSSGTYAYQA